MPHEAGARGVLAVPEVPRSTGPLAGRSATRYDVEKRMRSPRPESIADESAPREAQPVSGHSVHASSDVATAARNALKLAGSLLATWTVALAVRFQLPRHLGPVHFGNFNFCDSFSAAFFVFLGL